MNPEGRLLFCVKAHHMNTSNNPTESQESVIADYANELRQAEMEGYEMAIRKARNALFWAGGLIFAWEMIAMVREGFGFQPLVFIVALIEGGIFVGLGFWTKQKPFTAIICGLICFLGIIGISVVIYGMAEGGAGVLKALFSGIIVKVIILVNLILPIKEAKALQEARKQQF